MNHTAAAILDIAPAHTPQATEYEQHHSILYVARQPIFDGNSNVFAYELLFRSSVENSAAIIDGNAASSQVILNAFVDMGVEAIAEGRPVFVNFTRDFIVGGLPLPLPPEQLVVEILEDITVDEELVVALQKLSDKGYTLALDDYAFTDDKAPLFEKVDFIKIDLLACDIGTLESEVQGLKDMGIKLLAEKVETYEDFELCKSLGFDYFQGYYFSKPKILSRKSIKPNRLAVLRILSTLQDPQCNIAELEGLISNDVTISYKLLRIINSALYNLPREVTSVKQAIVALGLTTIREWMLIIVLTDIDDKPRELIKLCLQRARMMHELASTIGYNADAGFTTGLFSIIDAIMDQSMEMILAELPLADEITNALKYREGELGELLNVIQQYELGYWSNLPTEKYGAENLRKFYLESISWSSQLFEEIA